jgi:hypothetical protein
VNVGDGELGGGGAAVVPVVDGALLGREVVGALLDVEERDDVEGFDDVFVLCDADGVVCDELSDPESVGVPVGAGTPASEAALSDGVPGAPGAPLVLAPAATGPDFGEPDPPSALYAPSPTTATPARIAPIFSARGGRLPPRCRPRSASSW